MADDYNKDPRPLDPYNPMSAGPDPGLGVDPGVPGPGAYDQYGNARFEPVEERSRAPFILLGVLVAVGVIGGLVYFNHTPRDRISETAQAPGITDVRPVPLPPMAPGVAPLRTAPSDSGAAIPAAPLTK